MRNIEDIPPIIAHLPSSRLLDVWGEIFSTYRFESIHESVSRALGTLIEIFQSSG